jgi:hypothetical protein
MERMHAVAPGRRPVVAGEQRFERGRWIGAFDRDRFRIYEQGPARMVRNRAIRGKQVRDQLHGAENNAVRA